VVRIRWGRVFPLLGTNIVFERAEAALSAFARALAALGAGFAVVASGETRAGAGAVLGAGAALFRRLAPSIFAQSATAPGDTLAGASAALGRARAQATGEAARAVALAGVAVGTAFGRGGASDRTGGAQSSLQASRCACTACVRRHTATVSEAAKTFRACLGATFFGGHATARSVATQTVSSAIRRGAATRLRNALGAGSARRRRAERETDWFL
jgi:hypothetical protein